MCLSKTNCKECITSPNACAWCLQNVSPFATVSQSFTVDLNLFFYSQNFGDDSRKTNADMVRCDYVENIQKYCNDSFIFNPTNKLSIVKNEKFKPLDSNGLAVQIKPQKLSAKLRPRAFLYSSLYNNNSTTKALNFLIIF